MQATGYSPDQAPLPQMQAVESDLAMSLLAEMQAVGSDPALAPLPQK